MFESEVVVTSRSKSEGADGGAVGNCAVCPWFELVVCLAVSESNGRNTECVVRAVQSCVTEAGREFGPGLGSTPAHKKGVQVSGSRLRSAP